MLYVPFAVAAGPGQLWDSLVGAGVRDGAAWRLPFPLEYEGTLRGWPPRALAEDVKDVLGFYLPLIGVVGLVVAPLALRRRVTPAVAGLGVLALGALGYLLSRADELHAQPLLVILCALLPIAAASVDRAALVRDPAGADPARGRREPAVGAGAAAGPRAGAAGGRARHPGAAGRGARRCPRWWPPCSARSRRASRYTWLPGAPTS